MRVVVAPDKFKGSLDAAQAAAAIAAGIHDVLPDAECVLIPMADGGEGTVAAFLASGARAESPTVRGPLGTPVSATYARDGDLAVIEMAAASGLQLVDAHMRAPRRATTYGTGELVRAALDDGATRIVLGIGGSATTDGGVGALAALGARFLDDAGLALEAVPDRLDALATIDLRALDPRLATTDLAIACDVENPLLGANGAAAVYGPQKGADADDIAALDAFLTRIADAMTRATGRDLRALAGAGAAGGLGWALASACGARLERGVALVAQARGLAQALAAAEYCCTGEGHIDMQTLEGKVVAGVSVLAQRAGARVVAFGGAVDRSAAAALAAREVLCVEISDPAVPKRTAMAQAAAFLRAAAARTFAIFAVFVFAFTIVGSTRACAQALMPPPAIFQSAETTPQIVPSVFGSRAPLLRAQVGTAELWFTLDTGSPYLVISRSAVEALGMSGHIVNGFVTLDVRIGALSASDARFAVIDNYGFTDAGHRVSGILGAPFLGSNVVTIDFGAHRIVVYPRGSFDPSVLHSVAFPITFFNGVPVIPCTWERAASTCELDTGSQVTFAFFPFAKDFVIGAPQSGEFSVSLGVGEAYTGAAIYRARDLRFGRVHTRDPVLLVPFDASAHRPGSAECVLGRDVLGSLTMTFDYAAGVMYFS